MECDQVARLKRTGWCAAEVRLEPTVEGGSFAWSTRWLSLLVERSPLSLRRFADQELAATVDPLLSQPPPGASEIPWS